MDATPNVDTPLTEALAHVVLATQESNAETRAFDQTILQEQSEVLCEPAEVFFAHDGAD